MTPLLRATLALGVVFILLPLTIVILYSFSSVAYGVFPPPGLSLPGRAYRGGGLPEVIGAARATADRVCQWLDSEGHE